MAVAVGKRQVKLNIWMSMSLVLAAVGPTRRERTVELPPSQPTSTVPIVVVLSAKVALTVCSWLGVMDVIFLPY